MTRDDIKEAMILRVQPGDAIVLKPGRTLSDQELARLKENWQSTFRGSALADIPLVILDAASELTVVRHYGDKELTEIARESFKNTQA
jgi:hypothetical protein